MYYIIKDKIRNIHVIIEAKCDTNRAWHNAWGLDKHYEYNGINEDTGYYFDSRQIIKKSKAKTKEKVKNIYPEYFL